MEAREAVALPAAAPERRADRVHPHGDDELQPPAALAAAAALPRARRAFAVRRASSLAAASGLRQRRAARQPELDGGVHGVEAQALPVVHEDPARVDRCGSRGCQGTSASARGSCRGGDGTSSTAPSRPGPRSRGTRRSAGPGGGRTWLTATACRSYASGPRPITGLVLHVRPRPAGRCEVAEPARPCSSRS